MQRSFVQLIRWSRFKSMRPESSKAQYLDHCFSEFGLYPTSGRRTIAPMQIDIVSDTVCPWCFIGKRRLARAIALRPDVPFDVQWRPYRLDPTIPREGVDRRAYMKAKFGDSPRSTAMGD